jgi:hypothetical protein
MPDKLTPSPLGIIRIKSPDGKVKLFQANRKDRRAFLRRNRKRLVKI